MGKVRPTMERRQLGLRLRRMRERHGLTQQDAADALGRVRSRVVDLEDGRSTIRLPDLEVLLDLYHATAAERAELTALAIQAARRRRRPSTSDVLPDAFTQFAELEAAAVEICAYEPAVVPGLAQSPSYLRALIAEGVGVWWQPSDEEFEARVAFREERQAQVLGPAGPARLRFVLGEETLRAAVGDEAVAREQLTHLLRLTEDPRITIRLLLSSTPSNPARAGGFTVFKFGGRSSPVVFSSQVYGSERLFDDEADTARLADCFERLCRSALPCEETRSVLRETLKGSR
ncbi:helix-turn-helix transcriptional regulator [Kutzneria buriramensis]|uniref:Helix-turn-helix protein n=1 Tax=Kutzneria buriramensis TaxID=1045776 RepID=A0A3E0IBC9_9PSEU|nr:helix-turn-helix transcriptional regulator [Kutzneria buriramensis]REH55455.1 helix-turn-helix protein [Kutzneria buriramensis]